MLVPNKIKRYGGPDKYHVSPPETADCVSAAEKLQIDHPERDIQSSRAFGGPSSPYDAGLPMLLATSSERQLISGSMVDPLRPRPSRRKGKGKARDVDGGVSASDDSEFEDDDTVGPSPLLELPADVLRPIFSRLPPRSLLRLRAVCRRFEIELKQDGLWRECFAERFLGDAADPSGRRLEPLVRSCVGLDGQGKRGWRAEALAREAVLERFETSRAPTVVSNPRIDVVRAMSLLYAPAPSSSSSRPRSDASTPTEPQTPVVRPTPAVKVIGAKHRQPHRRDPNDVPGRSIPPNVLVVGAGFAARLDPLAGKTFQGHLWPGQITNLSELDRAPTAHHVPVRNASGVYWGLIAGHVAFTPIPRHPPSTGRLTSTTLRCSTEDRHHGAVKCVWAPEEESQPKRGPDGESPGLRFMSGGEDGRVKLWRISSNGEIDCLWTSNSLRKADGRTDSIEQVRLDCKSELPVAVALTTSGQVWAFRCDDKPAACRLYDSGPKTRQFSSLEMRLDNNRVDVLLHVKGDPDYLKLSVSLSNEADAEKPVSVVRFISHSPVPLTCLVTELESPPSISQPTSLVPADFAVRIATPGEAATSIEPPITPPAAPAPQPAGAKSLGNAPFVAAGAADGKMLVWLWDTDAKQVDVEPLASWQSGDGAITSIAAGRGLMASGSFDGLVKVWDPLTQPPTLLRTLRDRHLSSPASFPDAETHAASYYSVNAIVLEADMVVAAIGARILGWRAGHQKVKEAKKAWQGQVLGKHHGSGKASPSKGFDHHELRSTVTESRHEIRAEQAEARRLDRQDAAVRKHYDEMGLESTDEAVQLAMLLSKEEANESQEQRELMAALEQIERMEQSGASGAESSVNGTPAFLAADDTDDDPELRRALEQIELLERREAGQAGESSRSGAFAAAPSDEIGDPELQDILRQIREAEERERHGQGPSRHT